MKKSLLFITALVCTSPTMQVNAISMPDLKITEKLGQVASGIKNAGNICVNALDSNKNLIIASSLGAGVFLCNYFAYLSYRHLQSVSQEDMKQAAEIFASFILKTIFLGRESYTTNHDSLSYYPDHREKIWTALQRGYGDIINGNTSFVANENQIQAFRSLCWLSVVAPIGVFGSVGFLAYAGDRLNNLRSASGIE